MLAKFYCYMMFCDKENKDVSSKFIAFSTVENKDVSSKFIAFSTVEFLRICWTVKHICTLPSPCFLENKFEIEERNTKLQIARILPL